MNSTEEDAGPEGAALHRSMADLKFGHYTRKRKNPDVTAACGALVFELPRRSGKARV
jgi:hypothetical protein